MRSRKKAENIRDILDNCIELLLKGRSVEDCLNAYPKQARELESLLRISAATMQGASAIQPSSEFKGRVHSRLQDMFHTRAEQKRAKIPVWHRRWAVALASVMVIFIAGIGTVVASANALPDQFLYPVKLTSEEIRLVLTFSDLGKAELYLNFAQRRTVEMAEMARQGKDDKTLLLVEEADSHIDRLEKIIWAEKIRQANGPKVFAPSLPTAPFMSDGAEGYDETEKGEEAELVTTLTHSCARNLYKLEAALDEAPEELKPSLEQAIENMARNYDRTISNIESAPSS